MAPLFSTRSNGSFDSKCEPVTFFQSGFTDLCTTFAVWQRRRSRRRAAVTLDNRTLADIGLNRAQIDHEAAKPFWRP